MACFTNVRNTKKITLEKSSLNSPAFSIRLVGGIGNQLFQYCFAKSYSIKKKYHFTMDTSLLRKNPRVYSLNYFKISEPLVQNNKWKIYDEEFPYFYNEALNRDFCNKQICGFWQSEKYFKENWDIISKNLTFKESVKYNFNLNRNKSVFIHFRRSDYLDENNSKFLCNNLNYYNRALEYIMTYINDPILYIFSDDIQWVKENFKNKCEKMFVSELLNNDILELKVMSDCKYAIIANSTFSWWGAYLGNEKIVAAPAVWNTNNRIPVDSILPPNWKKIKIE